MPTPEQLAADALSEVIPGVSVPGLAELVTQMFALKQRLDEIETQEKALRKEYDEVRKVLIPAKLHEAGLTKAQFLVGTLSLRSKTYPRVPKGRQSEAVEWFYQNGGCEHLVVSPTALRDFVDVRVATGREIPPFVEMFTEEMAVLTVPRGVKSE